MNEPSIRSVAMIGFGEAGSILGADLAGRGLQVATYDILLDSPATRGRIVQRAQRAGVAVKDSLADAVSGAQLIISAVTAGASADVARAAGAALRPGQTLLDINSVSPAHKRQNAALVQASGANYVEAAVMAPVPPHRLGVPMLLGGPGAADLAAALRGLGMNARAIAEEIGIASAVKMCRSIVIKGLESLTVECLAAARRLGAEREVLESLRETFPAMGWTDRLPDYLVSRVAEHGRRRAEEMREVARTLRDAGIEPTMAQATAARQDALIDAMAASGLSYEPDGQFSWVTLLDALSGAAAQSAATAQPPGPARS